MDDSLRFVRMLIYGLTGACLSVALLLLAWWLMTDDDTGGNGDDSEPTDRETL